MILDFISEGISSMQDFDTSGMDEFIDSNDTTSFHIETEMDFDDSPELDDLSLDVLINEDYSDTQLEEGNEVVEDADANNEHYLRKRLTQSDSVSFCGNGRCRVCGCGGWAGFGDTCENCGHFYNKHI